jgi:hypothetical protein
VNCECGAFLGEKCQNSMEVGEAIRVAFVPRYLRGTVEAAGTWTGCEEIMLVAPACVPFVAFDTDGTPDPWVEISTR